jgi:protoporphyrinogen oxidase
VYTRYPFQANTFGLPPHVAYECVKGFVDAAASKPARAPQNFEEYCQQHFGAGISRHFMLPYNARLWGVPAQEITAAWCERFVPRPTLEDVIAGAVGLNDRELGYNAEFVYPRRGIGALSEALGRRSGPVELGRAPLRLEAKTRSLVLENERVSYDVLVSSIPLPALLDLFDDLPASVRAARGALKATSLYYLDVALTAPAEKDFHWVYVPEERYPFYRVGCYSHFSPDMAPQGCAGLYVELVDRAPPDLLALGPRVVESLCEMGYVRRASDVAFLRPRKIDVAYVIHDHRYTGALEVILPFLESEGVLSTGRYGGWNYSSMEDAIRFGRDAAKRTVEHLR